MNSGFPQQTLLRTLIQASGLSRRKAFAAIRESRVSVDGVIAVDPSSAFPGGELRLDGRILRPAEAAKTYLLMNKPAGVISANADARGRPTVLDLVPVELRVLGLHPVGRLDFATTGLLVLTNDGELTYRLTHPSHEVEKEYWLATQPPLSDRAIERLRSGVEIDGEVRIPVEVRALQPSAGFQTAMVIHEGRKRQVRRMAEAVGSRTVRLKRVREGSLVLGSLPEGQVRSLTEREVSGLMAKPSLVTTASSKGDPGPSSSASRSRSRTPARRT